MNNLTQQMQERLDKWRKNTLPVPAANKIRNDARYTGKRDYGDVTDEETWGEEVKKSQTRR